MQDFSSGAIRSIEAGQRMKAILKGHAVLPLALLYVEGPRINDHQMNEWAPILPAHQRLDPSLGYLEVYSNGLLVIRDMVVQTGRGGVVTTTSLTTKKEPERTSTWWNLRTWKVSPTPSIVQTLCLILHEHCNVPNF